MGQARRIEPNRAAKQSISLHLFTGGCLALLLLMSIFASSLSLLALLCFASLVLLPTRIFGMPVNVRMSLT